MDPLSVNQLSLTNQIIQYAAWLVALVEITLTLYILFLNPRHSSNRYVALLLLWNGINCFAVGQLIGASSITDAYYPTILLAITIPTVIPLLILASIILFKPDWLHSEITGLKHYRPLWWIVMGFFLLPMILVALDVLARTHLLFTGLNPSTYSGGFVSLPTYSQGVLRSTIQVLYYGPIYLVLLGLVAYFSFSERSLTASQRNLARLMLVGVIVSGAVQVIFPKSWPLSIPGLIASSSFAITYGYGGFQQIISGRKMQRGNLRFRLTALVLIITAPLLIAVVLFITSRLTSVFENEATNFLVSANRALIAEAGTWVDTNTRILQNMARQADIKSMQPDLQKPFVENAALSFPYMDLISTVDLQGQTLVRSDGLPAANYADQAWFQQTVQGKLVDFQLVLQKASNVSISQPSIIVSVPILGGANEVIGVLMFSTQLYRISDLFIGNVAGLQQTQSYQNNLIASQVTVYLVDDKGQVLAHPNKSYTATINDLNSFAPVAALSQGKAGLFVKYIGDDGKAGRAYIDRLSNGWGVVAQQPESAALAPLRAVNQISTIGLIIGMIVLCALVWLTIQQALQPVKLLTDTATAITAGDLNRIAPVESQDELGLMAQAFNHMTTQLRELIAGLEQRVNERTLDLTRRSSHLEAAAQVARQAAAITDTQELLDQTTVLIAQYFGYYHAGIFLLDNSREYAVLQASNSEGGQKLLGHNHKLRVEQTSIVGYVAEKGQPRIALDVGADAVFFNNPYLPRTRSEIAMPLIIRGQVIGVLDVQSTEASEFTKEDIFILQILADQIALAVNNARLLKDFQETLSELQLLYGKQTRHDWIERLHKKDGSQGIAFRFDTIDVLPEKEKPIASIDRQGPTLEVPISLRGQSLGSLTLVRDSKQPEWTNEEKKLVEEMISHATPALENARLLEQIQQRVQFEQALSQISSRIQGSLDIRTVMKTAIAEIGNIVDADKVEIRLTGQTSLDSDAVFQLPLMVRGEKIATLDVWPRQGVQLSEAEVDFLVALQDRLAQALESARSFQETQVIANREQYLNQLITQLSRSLDMDGLLQLAVRELGKMQGVNDVSIRLGQAGRTEASSGNHGDEQ